MDITKTPMFYGGKNTYAPSYVVKSKVMEGSFVSFRDGDESAQGTALQMDKLCASDLITIS